jgi:hypothetical protein
MQAPGRTIQDITKILEDAFKPLVCEVEPSHGDYGLHFQFRVIWPDGSVILECPGPGKDWYPFSGLQNNDTDLTNFVNHARDLVEKKTATKLDPWQLPP